jgi:hypothetical protein
MIDMGGWLRARRSRAAFMYEIKHPWIQDIADLEWMALRELG